MQGSPMKKIDANVPRLFYRPLKRERTLFLDCNYVKRKVSVFHGSMNLQLVAVLNTRIKTLEDELLHYRGMIDKLLYKQTEMLLRRISILEYCNSRLGENYQKIHQMHLDLLLKTQFYETQLCQSTSEERSASQNENKSSATNSGTATDHSNIEDPNKLYEPQSRH